MDHALLVAASDVVTRRIIALTLFAVLGVVAYFGVRKNRGR
jgi:hypothetical protein